MKLKNYITNLVIIFIFFNPVIAQENKILFKVNNEIITSIDILNEINYLKTINSEINNSEDVIVYEVAKNSIIKDKIKYFEILNYIDNIDIEEDILDNILLDRFKFLDIKNIEDLNEFFSQKNIEKHFVRKKISIEMLWNQIIYNKYKNKIKIDVEKIRDDLSNEKQKEIFLSEILFEVNRGEKLNKKYLEIKKMIDNENFSQAAIIYSVSDSSKTGGEIGWVKENSINKKILNELDKTKTGDYSKPIVVPGGFLVLNIKERRETKKNIDLEKEIKIITNREQNFQLNLYSNIYFNKLKKNININEL